MTITWIYVFTLMVVITFAIEIGQKITNTGYMEFADIVFGLGGFLAMFAVFEVIRLLVHLICYLLRKRRWSSEVAEKRKGLLRDKNTEGRGRFQ